MKTHFEKSKYFLILGVLFVFCGCNLLVAFLSPITTYTYLVLPSVILLVGLLLLYVNLTGKKHTFVTFIGLWLCSIWVVVLLSTANLISFSMTELWPIMVILSGLVLIPLGFIRYGFLPISFIVSAFVLFLLGFLFLLFSLNVIEMSITEFVSKWWPAVFIFFGLALIILFFYSKKHEQEKWVKSSEDFGD